MADEHDELSAKLRDVLLVLPNLPHAEAPDGTSDADNPIVRGPFNLPDAFADHQRVPHWEAGVELGILDNERAIKISGAMFTMTRGLGATLGRALCQLALDRNADAFEEIRPPSLVTTATLTASGQLPKFGDDAFAVERDDLWCIPTAEVPLTSIYRDEVLAESALPVRLMAATPCYRREAGSAGRDTRGMLRSHEFDKCEILALATPEQSPALLEEMVGRAEGTIAALGLPYRTIEICTGDLGQSHHRSFDIEVYAPGADVWLEVSSVSWFSDYQARRANIRYRREPVDGKPSKGTEIAHTLNGSALAVPRVWAAIVENFRQADGSVLIPEVLHPYMRGAVAIGPDARDTDEGRRHRHGPQHRRRQRAVRPAGAVRDGGARRRRRPGRARRPVAGVVRRRQLGRRHGAERDGAGDGRRGRQPRRPVRARARHRRRRLRVPHQLRQPQEPSGRRPPPRRRRVHVAAPAPPGPRARPDEPCVSRPRATPTSTPVPATARSVPGRRRRARSSPTAPTSTGGSPRPRPSSTGVTSRGPVSGAAGASGSTRSSSGRVGRAASTTASATGGTPPAGGSSSASPPETVRR